METKGGEEVSKLKRRTQLVVDQKKFMVERKKEDKSNVVVFQISDPHLGLFLSAQEMRETIIKALENKIDFVFITGDLLASEIYRGEWEEYVFDLLTFAFEPLKGQKTFMCLGNHDYEGFEIINKALKQIGVVILQDESIFVELKGKYFQVVGSNYCFKKSNRKERMEKLMEKAEKDLTSFPRKGDFCFRFLLIHDPNQWKCISNCQTKSLSFCGHVHGGIVALRGVNFDISLINLLLGVPDEGFWTKGNNFAYVHVGHGNHLLPFRVLSPKENSVLLLTLTSSK